MIKVDKDWTLFLDRDGVINKKIDNGYVLSVDDFQFLKGAKNAIAQLSELFPRIVIVTNQQCVGKGILNRDTLESIHSYMTEEIEKKKGRIDKIYFAPQLVIENSIFRKPNPGMALQAKKDFPEIDFSKSILIGDSVSDLEFAKKIGMKTIFISKDTHDLADFHCKSLEEAIELIEGRNH